jgi:ABC-2 type transport system ATP-binding protein
MTAAVELQNASKSFGAVKAVNNVSMSVQPGEIVAFLGPNGAGKTTAISLMLGLRAWLESSDATPETRRLEIGSG